VRGSNSMAGRLGEGETGGSRWTPGAGAKRADGTGRWRDRGRWAAPDADAEARRRRHNVLGPASRRLGWGLAERCWSSRTDGLGWTRAPVHEGARKALRGGPAPKEAGQRWRDGGLSSGRQPATSATRGRGGARAAASRSDSECGSFRQRPLGPGRVDVGQCCRGRFLAARAETGGRRPIQPMKARRVATQRLTCGSHLRLFL
jgi:hypothetical protein